MSSLSVETLSSLAFNSSLAGASDSEVTAVSLIGLAGVVLIFLSMLLVSAAGEPMPPCPHPHRLSLTSCPPRANPRRASHRTAIFWAWSARARWVGTGMGRAQVGLLVAGPRALGASDQLRTTLLCTEMQVAR